MNRLLASALVIGLAGCGTFEAKPLPVYFVFFDGGSAALTPQARSIVDTAAAAIKAQHPKLVAVGSGTPTGNNLALAEPRFNAIRGALIANGIDAGLIARSTLPQTDAKVGSTAATRVEIRLVADN